MREKTHVDETLVVLNEPYFASIGSSVVPVDRPSVEAGWQDILQNYDVKWVIMPTNSALSLELLKDGWRILYKDPTAIILHQ